MGLKIRIEKSRYGDNTCVRYSTVKQDRYAREGEIQKRFISEGALKRMQEDGFAYAIISDRSLLQ